MHFECLTNASEPETMSGESKSADIESDAKTFAIDAKYAERNATTQGINTEDAEGHVTAAATAAM